METIEFKQITTQEYNDIKKEISQRFKFVSIKRNNQQYAMGGFSLNPRDYNGLTEKQIDSICIFLKHSDIDTSGLDIQNEEVYGEEHGDFAGTKKKYLFMKNGISFLMRLDNGKLGLK